MDELEPKENGGFRDYVAICIDCGEEFGVTASAQRYFYLHGLDMPLKRCKSCHSVFKVRNLKLHSSDAPGRRSRGVSPAIMTGGRPVSAYRR